MVDTTESRFKWVEDMGITCDGGKPEMSILPGWDPLVKEMFEELIAAGWQKDEGR